MIKKALSLLKEDPVLFLTCCVSQTYLIFLKRKRGVSIGKGLTLKGIPQFEIFGNGKIIIGKNATLYSTRRKYFSHIASPVRFFSENGLISVGDNTRINGATIHARKMISIGQNCLIAANTSIIDSNGHELCLDNPEERIHSYDQPQAITIEDSVWIGLNSIILKGVTIGKGAVIGAGSIVTKDIPPYCLAAGNPVKIIKTTRRI